MLMLVLIYHFVWLTVALPSCMAWQHWENSEGCSVGVSWSDAPSQPGPIAWYTLVFRYVLLPTADDRAFPWTLHSLFLGSPWCLAIVFPSSMLFKHRLCRSSQSVPSAGVSSSFTTSEHCNNRATALRWGLSVVCLSPVKASSLTDEWWVI